MIRLLDAVILARTKRRTRRVRGALTTLVAGLLFSILLFSVIVIGGVQTNIHAMYQKSMSGRYIIGGQQWFNYNLYQQGYENKDLLATATQRYDKLVADKKAAAKQLGIQYDPTTEPLPYEVIDKQTGAKQLSRDSSIANDVVLEWIDSKQPQRKLDDFKSFAGGYHPATFYTALPFAPKNGEWREMKKGEESFEDSPSRYMSGEPEDLQQLMLAPSGLMKNYLIETAPWQPTSGHLPVIVTQKRAAELVGYAPPKKEASAQEKLTYFTTLRNKVQGATFDACYRNTASTARVQEAISTKKAIAAHANDKEYQKPALIYGLPDATSCGAAPVASDTRSAAEKTYATKQHQFDVQFGALEPAQQKITMEVVGVSPNGWEDSGNFALGFGDMVTMMMTTQTFRMTIPTEYYAKIPASFGYDGIFGVRTGLSDLITTLRGGVPSYYAEFTNANDARTFAKNETCNYGQNGGCYPTTKPFVLMPFGSNSLAIDEAGNVASKVLLWAGLAVMLLAALFASLMIGRTIADSRRETAVFRAIGFKRIDITNIYTVYTVLLCIDIVLFMLLLGVVGAVVLDHFFWVDTTARLQVLLGLPDSTTHFHYYGWSWYIIIVIAAVFAAGLVGLIPPLLRSIRRNPIRDMREE